MASGNASVAIAAAGKDVGHAVGHLLPTPIAHITLNRGTFNLILDTIGGMRRRPAKVTPRTAASRRVPVTSSYASCAATPARGGQAARGERNTDELAEVIPSTMKVTRPVMAAAGLKNRPDEVRIMEPHKIEGNSYAGCHYSLPPNGLDLR